MRILALNWRDWTHPRAGGAEEDLHQFCRIASSQGHHVDVFCARFPRSVGMEMLEGCRVTRVGNRLTVYPEVVRRIAARARHLEWDVVIDDVNGVPWFTPLFASGRIVAIFHHPVGRTFLQELPFPLGLLGMAIETVFPRMYESEIVTVRSTRIKAYLVSRGANPANVEVIPSGLDHSLFHPVSPKTATPSLLFAGPVKHYKHPEIAIDTLAQVLPAYPTATLTVVGKGMESTFESLRVLAHQRGVEDRVKFVGHVSSTELAELMSRSWVLLVPSEREGWGLAVVEAAACGTPTVAFDVGGLADSIREGETGVLVPYGDLESYHLAVERLISDTALLSSLSRKAHARSLQYSWERYYWQMMAAIDRTQDSRRVRPVALDEPSRPGRFYP